MHPITPIFLAALAALCALEVWLAWRQHRHAARAGEGTASLAAPCATGVHAVDRDEARADCHARLGDRCLEIALVLAWTLGGGLAAADTLWRGLGLGPVSTGVAVVATVALVSVAVDLPLRAWRAFAIARQHRRSATGHTRFAIGELQSALTLMGLGGPLAAALLALMIHGGPFWWLQAWLVWLGLNLAAIRMGTLATPHHGRRATALPDPDVRARLAHLLDEWGIAVSAIEVSGGANEDQSADAFCTGWGRRRRIVLSETLFKRLDHDELVAVVAHELAHVRYGHLWQRFAATAAGGLAGFATLDLLARSPTAQTALGLEQASAHGALALALLLLPLARFALRPVDTWLTRRQELAADAFAARRGHGRALARALAKIRRTSAAEPDVDPTWARFHAPQPSLERRIRCLLAVE